MAAIRLSFCIPTLNRGAFIGTTLQSIIAQASDEVEIVVVDGGSTDNTEELIRLHQREFPRLRYVRLETGLSSVTPSNIGYDRDCSRAVELAQGEYCWLMTDDDLLKPGAIAAVLAATLHNYGLIIVNAEVRDAKLSRILVKKKLLLSANEIYSPKEADRQRFMADLGNYLSFMGGIVMKRHLWHVRDKEKYFGTGFVHVGVIFQSPLPADTLVIAHPWIVIRAGNAHYSGTTRAFEFSTRIWPRLIWSFPAYSGAAKQRVCDREPWRRFWVLIVYRARGGYSLREYRKWIEPEPASRWFKLVARTIARVPGFAINSVISFYALVRRRALLLMDLRASPFYYRQFFRQVSAPEKNQWSRLSGRRR